MIKYLGRWFGVFVSLVLMGCVSGGDESPTASDTLQLIKPNIPTGQVVISNIQNFDVGVVSFQDCETKQFARPQPQLIARNESATYTLSEGCYLVVAGSAGLSFDFLLRDRRITVRRGAVINLP